MAFHISTVWTVFPVGQAFATIEPQRIAATAWSAAIHTTNFIRSLYDRIYQTQVNERPVWLWTGTVTLESAR
jgi:hypothetical protein